MDANRPLILLPLELLVMPLGTIAAAADDDRAAGGTTAALWVSADSGSDASAGTREAPLAQPQLQVGGGCAAAALKAEDVDQATPRTLTPG